MKSMRVIDFFCGAGGFSEGFRQAGFEIIMGIDNWEPAIKTHNLNHGLNDKPRSVLDFEDLENILALPDSEIIVGSPPCVSFSLSNKGGNADKSLGIRLIEAYLRVVAVKKHQPGSILKAWIMENVPNSRNFVKEQYTFADLNLSDWAMSHDKDPLAVALHVKDNGAVLRASDFGAPQARNRFVCGEMTSGGAFPMPDTRKDAPVLSTILSKLPAPLDPIQAERMITDPNYPQLSIRMTDLTDHFYDTGVYEIEWRKAQSAKQNHPYMGRMAFPENPDKPSRTVMATRSASTRESLLYESELKRIGDGQYRTPTIREAASLMGFPITYIFYGSQVTKWRQIGNSVCPQLSLALAEKILTTLKLPVVAPKFKTIDISGAEISFLDDSLPYDFSKPPKRNPNSLFRAHPVKSGNMTVAITNRHPSSRKKWVAAAYVGTGKGYKAVELNGEHREAANAITEKLSPSFLDMIRQDTHIRPYRDDELDSMNASYHYNDEKGEHPHSIITRVEDYIRTSLTGSADKIVDTSETALSQIKERMPLSQILAVSALGTMVLDEKN